MAKSKKLQAIHAEALKEFDEIHSVDAPGRARCLAERIFVSVQGGQWAGKLGEQFENKPKFEVNKIQLAITRIINEYRNNRITVDFVSKDGAIDTKLAETCDSLYRADEQTSNADEAYNGAFESALGGGIGAWRYRAEYDNDEDEGDRKKICIEPIHDADQCVWFDLGAKRQDKADAKRCFVLTAYTRSAYEEEFGDDPTSWPAGMLENYSYDWVTPDHVYVAEYYRVEETKTQVIWYIDIMGKETRYTQDDFDKDDGLEERLDAIGSTESRRKMVKTKRVHKYLLSGSKVLEDCGIIAGKHIPIVVVFGKRWYINGVEHMSGHGRNAEDAQRLKNMMLSKLAEFAALSGVPTPIVSPEQMGQHAQSWADRNITNPSHLLLNPVTMPDGSQQIVPVQYTQVPEIPPAMAALLQITEQDMNDLLGNQQAGEKMVSNISGKAVEMIHEKLDMQTFIYVSNFAVGLKRGGEIWLSMAKDLLTEQGRKVKAVDVNGKASRIELLRPVIDKETGESYKENDLSRADFEVVSSVGPSSSTKRKSTVRDIIAMMGATQDQETLSVLSAWAMSLMEGEGASDLTDFFRQKLVTMGAVKPTEEEQQKMQEQAANQQPDANTTYLNAAAEEATAKATKARADTVLTIAKAEETQMNTVKIASEIDNMEQQQAMAVIEKFGQQPNAQPPGAPTGEIED
jgi:hypothetical protein